ncbi:FAD-binding protein [Arthrobacter sp. ISL-72]|uniref:FAD-binding protein n=1 Tax=Arthrobacter sp. ISL-72 TaxID=2819114 RepID=UPI001BE7BFE2|nr:FAD-binding protein [Arthrobacter sp. ISL-72]MBT2597422.1 FAD-binding protein [Arthrobacter sp. ISL-72]
MSTEVSEMPGLDGQTGRGGLLAPDSTEGAGAAAELNWAGNYRYTAPVIHRPRTLAEVQEVVAAAPKIRALGSRHSFNSIADSPGALISLESLDPAIRIDAAARTVTVSGGTRYGTLAEKLQANGYALPNLASLPHISVAGAIATATHGSGDANGNLATSVAALQIVAADGTIHHLSRGNSPDFDGAVVGLGALGVVTKVTLDIEPTFAVRQDVFEGLPWQTVLESFDAATSSAYSVSLFTDWSGDAVAQSWLKSRLPLAGTAAPEAAFDVDTFFGGTRATAARHPLPGVSAENCTEQLGVPGPWSERLAHFRMAFTPSSGDELQSEFFVRREHAVAAIAELRALSHRITPLLHISEIRTVAADQLWLSTAYGQDSVGFHFTWKQLQDEVEELLPVIEEALAPLDARPHWGKLFHADARSVAGLYPRFDDFKDLAERMDPEHKFRNEFLARKVFGE